MSIDAHLVDELFESLVDAVGDEEINAGSIITIASLAMVIVERQRHLSGDDKKALVIELLHKLVNSRDMSSKEKRKINLVIDATVPSVIDTIIDASKGGLDVNKLKSRWMWIRENMCCCCARN